MDNLSKNECYDFLNAMWDKRFTDPDVLYFPYPATFLRLKGVDPARFLAPTSLATSLQRHGTGDFCHPHAALALSAVPAVALELPRSVVEPLTE